MGKQELLQVEHLSISFEQYGKGLKKRNLPVMEDLNLTVRAGEMTAVVGSSGSGKSLLAHGILGLLPYNGKMSGRILYNGEELTAKIRERTVGTEIVLVPQSVSYLDPLMKVGDQVRNGDSSSSAKKKCSDLFRRYGLGTEAEEQYPFELSGGMIRRVLISAALMENPRLIIADEPTPGLHLSAAKRVLGHFRELADQGAGVLLITHDLELALEAADRIAVFYAGTTVEEMPASSFKCEDRLHHPYSKALYRAMPANGFQALPGIQPYVTDRGKGCVFAERCSLADKDCYCEKTPVVNVEDGWVRCRKGG